MNKSFANTNRARRLRNCFRLMELSKKRFYGYSCAFLVYIEVIILLSCFNLHGLNLLDLATASPAARGNETDEQALLRFKAKITVDRLGIMDSWNSSVHFCQWHGVTCGRKHQRVTKLELQFLKLSGSLSPDIGNLSFLRELNLAGNSFYNKIPQEIGHLRRLETLDLTNNSISGEIPSNLSACSKLTSVGLRSNQLTGDIPAFLGLLSSLKVMVFTNNSLSGSVPPSFGNLSSLEVLILRTNALTGTIPEALGQLTKLAHFSISENEISGIIPAAMFNLSSIRVFNIGGNNIQGVTLVSTCLLILWFKKKKEQQPTTCAGNSLLQLSYQSILRATDGFSPHSLIGSGSFGSVYKVILEGSGAAIAVKVLNLLNRGASKSFLAECQALKNIRHRNLIKLLTAISGIDYQGNDFKALVYEFMENGSLEDWLHQSVEMNELDTTRNLNFFQRVSVAIDVAHALEYLHHHCETSIIHCDLKPSNILLDEEMVGHLSDFGLAKILYADILNFSANQSSSLGLRGTIGYAPPEYAMGGDLSTKGDVYSYGILLLEMFTGKRPTQDMFKEGFSIRNFVMAAVPEQVSEIVDPFLLQERSKQGTLVDITLNDMFLQPLNSIFQIGLTCSAGSPTERMEMSDVVSKLCSIRDKLLRPAHLHHEHRTLYASQSAGT